MIELVLKIYLKLFELYNLKTNTLFTCSTKTCPIEFNFISTKQYIYLYSLEYFLNYQSEEIKIIYTIFLKKNDKLKAKINRPRYFNSRS